MPTLTPTVQERLARCGREVYVDGIDAGAKVTLDVGGNRQSAVVPGGGGYTFAVPQLQANAQVRANQDTGAGPSPWSPSVTVEGALVPPQAAPRLPDSIGDCSGCVLVDGLVPGCEVVLSVSGRQVGSGIADGDGSQCVGLDLSGIRERKGLSLDAVMKVCGQAGPRSSRALLAEAPLTALLLSGPLFGCQSVVPTHRISPGAAVHYESSAGADLGSLCSCWTDVNVSVAAPLVVNQKVRARPFWTTKGCSEAGPGPWSPWEPVVAPDQRIKPEVLPVLVEGDQIIRVGNQISGSTLIVKIAADARTAAIDYGPRPSSSHLEIALNEPLKKDNVVSVVQTLCGVSVASEPVTVIGPPKDLLAPVVLPPLYECGAAVRVSNLYPGAVVRFYVDGIPVGLGWAGDATSLTIAANPSLSIGQLRARQWVGGKPSPFSAPVPVMKLEKAHTPRILAPVAFGDTQVWVSGVSPGSRLRIMSGGQLIGESTAAEPVATVGVDQVAGPVRATASLCNVDAQGPSLDPITDPCSTGPLGGATEEFVDLGMFNVAATADGPAFTSAIKGQLYRCQQPRGAGPPPLVLIMHGYWSVPDTYTGYDYLARHLASWGIVVFTISADDVNNKTTNAKPCQYSRGRIILEAVDRLLASKKKTFDRGRVGLVGHSMGGEGVVAAQALNLGANRPIGIRGVVSIAPTNYHNNDLVMLGAKYMQLIGSLDLLLQSGEATGQSARFSGFRIYDHAQRPKTHFYIRKARHNPFNRRWIATGDHFESGIDTVALPHENHERIARCLINAFFLDSLLGKAEYAGYMEGTILPPSLREFKIYTQFSSDAHRKVIDNYGDADPQAGLGASAPNSAVNRLNLPAGAAGAGLGAYEVVDHKTLANSPHDTLGLHLSWKAPNVVYKTSLGGVGGGGADTLGLRVAQFFQDDQLNPPGLAADAILTVNDGNVEAAVRLGAVGDIPYPNVEGVPLTPMRTVRMPLDALQAANPALNIGALQSASVATMARWSGDTLIDDLELGG